MDSKQATEQENTLVEKVAQAEARVTNGEEYISLEALKAKLGK